MNDFTSHHSTLPNEDLVRIAYFEKRKTKKETRLSARSILQQRGLSTYEIEALKKEIRERIREERNQRLKDKNDNYSILDFIIDILFYI